jgi:hypothetical protein
MCGYLPHIIICSLVDLHCKPFCPGNCTGHKRSSRALHATDAIVPLPHRCVLVDDVTGACDVVSVTRPSPCARLPHSNQKLSNCSSTIDVGFGKLTLDSFCGDMVFKMNIQL